MSEENRRGFRLGQLGGMRTLGTVLGTGVIWLSFSDEAPQYLPGFLCAAGGGVVAAAIYSRLKVSGVHYRRSFFVMRRKFWLYYVLEFLFGARKQIFITFGPWVLIHVYGLSPGDIAFLLMLASGIGLVFKPVAGWAMDEWGERVVMVGDGLTLTLVCLGYGFAGLFPGGPRVALLIAGTCFILDNLLFALGTGRTVYVSRLASDPDELTGTLSLGVTVNHIGGIDPVLGRAHVEGIGVSDRLRGCGSAGDAGGGILVACARKRGARADHGGQSIRPGRIARQARTVGVAVRKWIGDGVV